MKLVSVASRNDDVGVVSPIHLTGNGSELDFKFSNYIIPKHCPNFYSDIFLNKLQDDIYTVRFVNAAAWLISRNCIETVGGFNPIFTMYGEDDDYLHRVHYHGFKVGIYPFSKIYHDRTQINTTKYFTNEDKILKRDLLVEYCNINNNIDIKYKFRELSLSCIKSIIKLKYDEFIKYRYQFKILLKYYKDIANARKKSMKQGLTFMLND
jgi:GT2 family glycosyltransferase